MKAIFKIFLIVLVSILLQSSRCRKESDTCHKTINFVNNSSIPIYVARYSDTIIPNYIISPSSDEPSHKIASNSSSILPLSNRYCWEDYLDYDEGKINAFIFDANMVDSIPWDTVIENQLFIKQYNLNLRYLNNMNWEITYP